MIRARRWPVLLAVVALALHERVAYAADYWEKPLRFIFLDVLILTSPLTGIFAIMTAINPRWRERPKKWRTSRETPSYAHEWLTNHLITLSALSALSVSGLVVLFLHMMSML